jgi:two-component system CheB/CheR fusion protein
MKKKILPTSTENLLLSDRNTVMKREKPNSARKLLAKSEKHFRHISESMPQKVWTADAAGNRNYFNSQWTIYSGLSQNELKNDGWKSLIHPEDLNRYLTVWKRSLDTGQDFELEVRKKNIEGHYKWHLSRATPIRDDSGKIIMWIGTNTEMEKQKNHSTGLEKEIADRTSELLQAYLKLAEKNIELENMNKELESFAYISSHDLQEPLRKIQIFAGRLLEKENENLSPSGQDMLERMKESGRRMQSLIQDLLKFSRVGKFERKFENTNLNELIEQALSDLKVIIDEKKATFEISSLCEIKVIRFQIVQLFYNLIINALKFSKPGTNPHIIIRDEFGLGEELKVARLSPHKKYCHITLIDNGIGFDPAFNVKIFEVFQKLHSKDEYEGTGIGLAIVKRIIDNHEGVIMATSEPEKGARFDIYLPVDKNI